MIGARTRMILAFSSSLLVTCAWNGVNVAISEMHSYGWSGASYFCTESRGTGLIECPSGSRRNTT